MLPAEAFFPNGFSGMLNISALPGAFLQVDVQILPTVAAETPMTEAAPSGVDTPQKLGISILEARGLQHMNHFTGDHPYVQAEIKHMGHHAKVTRAQTRPITQGDTLNPFWDERLEL